MINESVSEGPPKNLTLWTSEAIFVLKINNNKNCDSLPFSPLHLHRRGTA